MRRRRWRWAAPGSIPANSARRSSLSATRGPIPEHSAGATNGLAVAYLQLGRPDLAERFFKEAIALDPGNRKYQANLNRFYEAVPQVAVKATREEAPALAGLTMQPQIAAPQAAPQAMANVSQISSVSFEQTTGRMQRVSASEVVIGAAPAAIAAAPGERRRAATAAAAPAAVVQDRRRRNPAYPVRSASPRAGRQSCRLSGAARAGGEAGHDHGDALRWHAGEQRPGQAALRAAGEN